VPNSEDTRWLAAAANLSERARPLSRPNPAVGAVIVRDGIVIGRGWTQPGGRPHAEAVAIGQAGQAARGATLYVSLEPCFHQSSRGPACADLVAGAELARVVIGIEDPDERTAGRGLAHLRAQGLEVTLANDPACAAALRGFCLQREENRPEVTLKLAMSLDGCIAMASGESKWITGAAARAHAHRERARADAILVGGGTLRADLPRLDVRLPGLEKRSPERIVLTGGQAPAGWLAISSPQGIFDLPGIQHLMIEGGSETASAFLASGLVDRLLVYRAPILIGGGRNAIGEIGNKDLAQVFAKGGWRLHDRRELGRDTLEVYHPANVERD